MKIRSIKLTKDLDRQLKERAQSTSRSSSAVLREALAEYLVEDRGASRTASSVGALAADLAGCASGPPDLSDVIIDTGPLVAFLNRKDEWHDWAVAQLTLIAPPLLTCEAVLSEAAFLLRRDHAGVDGLLQMVHRRLVTSPFRADDEIDDLRRLMKRYADVPMSLADACLVRMAEKHTRASVMTLDEDFRIYRRLGRQIIPLIAPPRPSR